MAIVKDCWGLIHGRLSVSDICSLSEANKYHNSIVKNSDVWRVFCIEQFPDYYEKLKQETWLETFKLCYGISKLKVQLKLEGNIYEIYQLTVLDLKWKRLTAIPKEIGQLTNLQTLNLLGNQLTEISKEICQLTNLQELYLSSNQITDIPKEIDQLTNLQIFR